MTRISAPAVTAFLSLLLIAPALPAQASDTASSTVGVSKVRIVRLSEIKGQVVFDVNGGQGVQIGAQKLDATLTGSGPLHATGTLARRVRLGIPQPASSAAAQPR